MLLTAQAYAEGGRALAYWTALQLDKELSHADEAVRKDAADLVALLTPIVKAFLTDNALDRAPRTACRSSAATASSPSGAWSSSCATRAST